ncbi:ATP-binding protein [Comamonadaceae bacterium OH3737_COT-264]|nr:ATP-binding protein [Comamonadaceae bacterium OH3737_COT-264]
MQTTQLMAIVVAAAALAACGSAPKQSPQPSQADVAQQQALISPTQSGDGVLIGPKGMTLYTFAKDTAHSGTSVCNGQCAVNWPPLAVDSKAKPLGDYTIITRADGAKQWAYKGMPLYYFVKDQKPGDKLGDGLLNGAWKVARP